MRRGIEMKRTSAISIIMILVILLIIPCTCLADSGSGEFVTSASESEVYPWGGAATSNCVKKISNITFAKIDYFSDINSVKITLPSGAYHLDGGAPSSANVVFTTDPHIGGGTLQYGLDEDDDTLYIMMSFTNFDRGNLTGYQKININYDEVAFYHANSISINNSDIPPYDHGDYQVHFASKHATNPNYHNWGHLVYDANYTVSFVEEFRNQYYWDSNTAGRYDISVVKVVDGVGYNSTWDISTPTSTYVNETTFNANDFSLFTTEAPIILEANDQYGNFYTDVLYGTGYASVSGYVKNAVTGTAIDNASVSYGSRSTTSDTSGYYSLSGLSVPADYVVTASKSGYETLQATITLGYESSFSIDIPLIPEEPSHTGHGILGLVRTLPYYQPVENQDVLISNSTWNDTTTSNNDGYYIFDNLEIDTYWINVSRSGYSNNNQTVVVSSSGDVIVTIDNADATAGWDSDNTLTLDTVDKQEGTGSLQSAGSNAMDFNKTFASAVNASSVVKSNGYLAMWYEIDDVTRLDDYVTITVGSNGDNTTNKISWNVYKSNFVNSTWNELFLKFTDGIETGTLNMSNINWFELIASKSGSTTTNIDDIRFYDFSYEIHHVDLDPILALGVIAKDYNEDTIASFTATLDNTSLNTTSGQELIFTNLSYGMYELGVTADGYYPYQRSVYLDTNTNITAYMSIEIEAGTYYPPPHYVEFTVVDIWGQPFVNMSVTALAFETTVGELTWFEKLFGYNPEVEVYNETLSMSGTTDHAGHINFFMIETIKYKMWFTEGNTSAYREIYPKDDRYVITIGEIPAQKIAYWITSDQNDTNLTGNITINYCDYNDPVKTNWVNFSIYYFDNDTFTYSHNFTTINQTNSNTSSNLNTTYTYMIKLTVNHDDFGEFTQYITVTFIIPERPKLSVVQELVDNLEDWQVTMVGIGLLTMFALIFGAVSSGVGGMVLAFMGYGFYYFGMLPLISRSAAYVIFPLITIMAILNMINEQKEVST